MNRSMLYEVHVPALVLVDRCVEGTVCTPFLEWTGSVALAWCMSSVISQWNHAPVHVGKTQDSVAGVRLHGI